MTPTEPVNTPMLQGNSAATTLAAAVEAEKKGFAAQRNLAHYLSMMMHTNYNPKVKPTEETAIQPRKYQDRSKYLGNGNLRPQIEIVSEEGTSEAAPVME